MADIYPFRGVRYNQALVHDLTSVICPPYDIITPQMQRELYQRSDYNFVRLEYTREEAGEDKYARAAAALQDWLERGILEVDEAPALYLYDHYFTCQGRQYRRRGIISAVRLEAQDKLVVRPHENTMARPKSDRLRLLQALRANTSSVLALFADNGQRVSSLLAAQEREKPVIDFGAGDGERHRIWAITGDGAISQIRSCLAGEPLYIADGHHRYESALNYQHERQAMLPEASGDEGFNFAMITLVDFADPGLVILPIHRLVCGVSHSALEELPARLKPLFEVEELPLDKTDVWQKVDDFLAGEAGQVKLAIFGLTKKDLVLLRLRSFAAADRLMAPSRSGWHRRLAASVVDRLILEKMLGFGPGSEETSVSFSSDRVDAVNKVLSGEYQMAFLLGPVRAEVIKAVADAGDKMPKKSTYFYPKLPSGLVFRRLA